MIKFSICKHNLDRLEKASPKYLVLGIKTSSLKIRPPVYDNVEIVCNEYSDVLKAVEDLKEFRVFEIFKELEDTETIKSHCADYIKNINKDAALKQIEQLKKEHDI